MSDNVYCIVSIAEGKTVSFQARCSATAKPGETVSGKEVDGVIRVEEVRGGDYPEYQDAIEALSETIVGRSAKRSMVEGLDIPTSNMNGALRKSALLLCKKLISGAPIVVRFHNDSDGASGGYALYTHIEKMLNSNVFRGKPRIVWKMQKGIAYSEYDAQNDILTFNNYDCLEKPLLLCLDFGTSEESNAGISSIKEKFDIIWLDHHPPNGGFDVCSLGNYINPWNFGGDSNYTAGFLSSKFGDFLSDVDCSCVEDASFIGDYSIYAKRTKCGFDTSLILDMITGDRAIAFGMRGDITPAEIGIILGDENRKAELAGFAKSKLDEALDSGFGALRKYSASGAEIYSLDFNNVRDEQSTDRYPMPGRFASKMLERIEQNTKNPAVLILYFGKFVSVRLGAGAKESIDMAQIIKKLREENDNIDSGGGHANAASIRMINEEGRAVVIASLIEEMKKALEK